MIGDLANIPDPRNPIDVLKALTNTPGLDSIAEAHAGKLAELIKSMPPFIAEARVSYEVYFKETNGLFGRFFKREIWIKKYNMMEDGFFDSKPAASQRALQMQRTLREKAYNNHWKILNDIENGR